MDFRRLWQRITGFGHHTGVRSAARLERTCIHEAGHALMMGLLPSLSECEVKIVLNPGLNGKAYYPRPDLNTRSGVLFEMQMSLAGREAERLFTGEYGAGSSNDLNAFEQDARYWSDQQDNGPPLFRVPANIAEAGHNAAVLRQIRAEQGVLVRNFLAANRQTLDGLITQLRAQSILEQNDLEPLLASITRTPGLAVIPTPVQALGNADLAECHGTKYTCKAVSGLK